MILNGNPEQHHKHTLIPRPSGGEYGRNELAFLGAPCGVIRQLAVLITEALSAKWKIAYLDADHNVSENAADPVLAAGALASFTNKITYQQINYAQPELQLFQKKALFNAEDLILINGNHFTGNRQIIIIDPAKPLEKKLNKLTNVVLILLTDNSTEIPGYLKDYLPGLALIPTLLINDTQGISGFINNFLQQQIPPLNGLVLTGGKSIRMGVDKSDLNYHGLPQKEYVYQMLTSICNQVYVSVNEQHLEAENFPLLADSFTGLGPMAGILSALRSDPNAAWLVLACDLPFLTQNTLQFLINNRNPSKTATAFYEPNGNFPEPLVTIWEPRSYPVLLQALGQGYSCPRKVLINSDIDLLQAPNASEFENVNDNAAYEHAKELLQTKQSIAE